MPSNPKPDPQGYYPISAFSAALFAVPAASTHFLLVDGGYQIWANAPFAVFLTDAAHDPPAVPATQAASWPGALVDKDQVFRFTKDSRLQISVGGVLLFPTGIRVFQTTATAGIFYCTELGTRVG